MTEPDFTLTLPLIIEHLERRGWEHYPAYGNADEVWLLPGRIQFEGDDAAQRAYYWQVREEVEKRS